MTRWIRKLLPPPWIVWLFSIFYGLFGAFEYVIRLSHISFPEPVIYPRGTLILLACASYAIFRVLNFHPACRSNYRQWLRAVPWTARSPLPAGPVNLALQDVLTIALLAALGAGTSDATPMACLATFSAAYLFALSLVNAGTGGLREAYIAAFGLGLAARLREHDVAWIPVLACVYVVAVIGLRRSMTRFPWDTPLIKRLRDTLLTLGIRFQEYTPEDGLKRLGFPYDALQPRPAEALIPARHALLLSFLAAWSVYIVLWNLSPTDTVDMTTTIYVLFPIIVAVLRTAVYCRSLWPPISILGRVVTLRWIIPGYDHVLISPFAAMMLGLIAGWSAQRVNLPLEIGGPIIVFGVLVVTLLGGPTLGGWRLLGQHRTIGPIANSELIKL